MLRKVGPVTYEVDMLDRTKRRRIFHVNMLRKWYTPSAASYWTDVEPAPEAEEDAILWKDSESGQNSVFGQELVDEQRRDLLHLLDQFADVLQDKPGKTTTYYGTYH